MKTAISLFLIILSGSATLAQEAPMGSAVEPGKTELKALEQIKGRLKGKIVWSTSRASSRHDIWIMNADGTDKKALTRSNQVDWFPRLSPTGDRVLFTRSKTGWVPETDADFFEKWDLFIINLDGSNEHKAAENACWGTWRPSGDSIVFARGTKVFAKSLATGEEKMIFDGEVSIKEGTIVQQPQLSPNGKYLAATLRGRSRETGIWRFEKKEWYNTGKGCQVDWFPDSDEIYRINPTGNGGRAAPSEILQMKLNDGRPVENLKGLRVGEQFKLMDLPGRRSHEYFPKFDPSGQWLVWGATDNGHDHDIYDYEIHLWKRGTDQKKDFIRLTFHTGNDRWPDIFLGDPKPAQAPAGATPAVPDTAPSLKEEPEASDSTSGRQE